ncbi:Gfo/Idh/MocA family protein [Streptomonospora sp. PA3]|uniref:Gfo/Idh/MocA family protein n=1 Tax=Streptomonospora sp. PA3 TaxID=2607326 RepID=UPI002107ED41|nr:Gfo/Idh/MocA family oxidoreductase [Streptomonospora sp. PA3]
MPPRPRLRIGLIGLGAISRFYLAALERAPSLHLAAVCDRDPDALSPLRGRVPCYLDHRELLAEGGLDAVVVCAPNHMHAPLCRDVLAAGLPVCVEKPLATLPADGAALQAEARLRKITLFTAFHRRYNRPVRALVDRLPAGVPVTAVRVRYLERIEEHIGRDSWYLDPGRCGGGCVADNGPNAFDLVRVLLGPVSVSGASIARDAAGVDRRALVRLHSPGGAAAAVELDWSYAGERHGRLGASGRRPHRLRRHARRLPRVQGIAVARVRGRAGGLRAAGARRRGPGGRGRARRPRAGGRGLPGRARGAAGRGTGAAEPG